jgi:V8-like Glu-specific endopeptidase
VFNAYTLYPYVTIGKLFFKQYGVYYVASASSMGNNAIWTAGHCVHAGNNIPAGWSTNMVFVPAYRDGAAPYGQWPAKQLSTTTPWYSQGNPNGLCLDMGGASLFPNGAGKKISQVVGSLGFAWNYSRYQHWHSIGYPAAAPFTGGKMVTNQASFAYAETGLACTLKPNGIGSDMTGGCSGGPWILQFGTNNYINGHNSYRYSNRPLEIKSPYIGNDAKSLWNTLMSL